MSLYTNPHLSPRRQRATDILSWVLIFWLTLAVAASLYVWFAG